MSELKNPRELISQTNNTILFAKVNGKKDSLSTILSEVDEDVDGDINEKVKENLLVKNFDDFLEKFNPTIYSSFNKNEEFVYDIEYDERKKAYPLKNSEVLDMLIQLLESKKMGGQKNLDFDYEKLLELITPQNTVKKMKQDTAKTLYLFEEYDKYPKGDPKRKELGTLLTKKLKANREVYDNYPTLLAIAVDNVKSISERMVQTGDNKKGEPVQIGMPSFNDEGVLEFKKLPAPDYGDNKNSDNEPKKLNLQLAEKIEKDYELQVASKGHEVQQTVKNLLTFGLRQVSKTEITPEDKKNHDLLLTTLQKEKESFFKAIVPLLQTILGVKSFFDQFSESSDDEKEAPKLLITNCNAKEFADKDKDLLDKFLLKNNSNNETKNSYWFAIVPDVAPYGTSRVNKDKKSTEDDAAFDDFETVGDIEFPSEVNCDKNQLNILTEVLAKWKITCFFNFQANRQSSFLKMTISMINKIKENTEILEKDKKRAEMIVNCLPNFTVIPEGKRYNLGSKLVKNSEENNKNSSEIVTLPGFFIDASYIACGLVASWQSVSFLKKRFGSSSVSQEDTGVRVDIEKNENSHYLYTTFAREGDGYSGLFEDKLAEKPYGFIFSSNKINTDDNLPKDRITVLKARTLAKEKNGGYKELYKVLAKNYLTRFIKADANVSGDKIGEDKIKRIVDDEADVETYKSRWERSRNFVNALLQAGDNISYNQKTKKIDFSFAGKPELIELEIEDK